MLGRVVGHAWRPKGWDLAVGVGGRVARGLSVSFFLSFTELSCRGSQSVRAGPESETHGSFGHFLQRAMSLS